MIARPRETSAPRAGVVLLHGFAGWQGTMWPLARTLRRAGYRTLTPFYPSWRMPLAKIVEQLTPSVARFTADVDGPLHFVGFSMGGLLTRALIHHQRPARLGRIVMLGTPNSGSEIADMLADLRLSSLVLGNATAALVTRRDESLVEQLGTLDYPVGVIAGDRPIVHGPISRVLPRPHDGKVSVAATHVAGETAHITLPLSHAMLPIARSAHDEIRAFLETGAFLDKP